MSVFSKRRSKWDKPTLDIRISWIEKSPHYKRAGTEAGMRFARYHGAKSVDEYLTRGGTWADLQYDEKHNLLAILRSGERVVIEEKSAASKEISRTAGGIYIVTLNNEELIATQAHDRRFDDKDVLKVNRDNRKFGKALDFNGRERQGYYRTFGEKNVNFLPIVAVEDADSAERSVKSKLLPWCLRSPSNRTTEWTAGIGKKEMIEKILSAVKELGMQYTVVVEEAQSVQNALSSQSKKENA